MTSGHPVLAETEIKGNVPPEMQEQLIQVLVPLTPEKGFASEIYKQLRIKEMSLFEREQDGRMQARIIFEITVNEDMVNAYHILHGGCVGHLIDGCTSVTLALLEIKLKKPVFHVSQALNIVFHAAAPLGSKLKIVNTTTAMGGRTMTAAAEIWDVTNRRLVASGVHTKMQPKIMPKL